MVDLKKIEEIKNLAQGSIILIETSAENTLEIGLFGIKLLLDEGYQGIVISANRPYLNLIRLYNTNGIDTNKIFFIDCISEIPIQEQQESSNVMYLEHVSDLTNISLAITKASQQVGGKRFVFIDSITTMLIHNQSHSFAKFVHSILTKMRLESISALLVWILDENNNEVRAEIAQLCDKVVKIE